MQAFLIAALLALSMPALALEFTQRLEKPPSVFFYPQLNIHGGYDSAEPGGGIGLANRGPRSQAAFEWLIKDRDRLQLGYTRLIQPDIYNFKFGVELDPKETDPSEFDPRFRLYDVWTRFETKWDRTWVWVGHKTIPYGHNPQLDPQHAFLPNQAGLDLGFGRDSGLFAQTPVSEALDLEVSATLGKGDTFDYHGGWLLSSRLGQSTFLASEIGVFAMGGRMPRARGTRTTDRSLTDIARAGLDWVYKWSERAKMVQQFSAGSNAGPQAGSSKGVYNMLNSFECYPFSRWSFGVTHAIRLEDTDSKPPAGARGELYGTISYALARDIRLRANLFSEYRDTFGRKDEGVMVQLCLGCGLIK